MTTKEIQIKLSLPSSLPDLTCSDGEVESFQNVDWLSRLAEEATKPGNSSSSAKPESILNLSAMPTGINLPAGSSLLTIHSPKSDYCNYIIHTESDALAIYNPTDGLTYIHASVANLAGTIRRALPFGNFILLLTDHGPKWLIFNPVNSSYTLVADSPKPPQVSFQLSPIALDGYSLIAGQKPELSVAVDIPDTLNVSESMFSRWLDEGSGSSIMEEAKLLTYRGVGKAVAEFESIVSSRGLYLTAPQCIAACSPDDIADAVLPSTKIIPSQFGVPDYTPPVARLLSWSYHAGTLRLQIQFSLAPMRLSASFSVPSGQSLWMTQFSKILFGVTAPPKWHDKGYNLSASALTTYVDPSDSSRNGYAFRFADALSADQLSRRTKKIEDFRLAESAPLSDAASGMVIISSPTSSAPRLIPDYRDFTLPTALDGITTDRGFILFGGHANRVDENGNSSSHSLEKSIIASHKTFPFIFRHQCAVSDGAVVAVSRASGSAGKTSTGRHPLHVLSRDGIRLIESDIDGEFINTKLINRLAPIPDSPIAIGYDKIFFMTQLGLASLSMSSKIELLDSPAISIFDSSSSSIPAVVDSKISMGMLGDNEALLIISPGSVSLYDLLQSKEFPQPDLSIRSLHSYQGQLLALQPDGALRILTLTRSLLPQENQEKDQGIQVKISSPKEDSSEDSSLLGKGRLCPDSSQEARILTRPLKLGVPFRRKRILSIAVAHTAIAIILEASDNLIDWQEIARKSSTLNSNLLTLNSKVSTPHLHLPAARYYRLQLSAPTDIAPLLTQFQLTIKS